MRILLDANVLVSMLLSPKGAPAEILLGMVEGSISALVSQDTISEVRHSCREKSYLAHRIPSEQLESFLDALASTALILPPLEPPFSRYTRDPLDDYLIAHALAEQVEVLVSGDRHLLSEQGRYSFQILSPAEFVVLLDACEP